MKDMFNMENTPDEMIDLVWEYTPSEALFGVAFRYKKTKLWKKLYGDDLFALRFSDGTCGYVNVMGRLGSHCAIGVYPDEESLRRLQYLSFAERPLWYALERERALQQSCLQLILDNKDYLRYEEEQAARAYAKSNGIRFSGANAFPHFQKFIPGHLPWHPMSAADEQYLLEAAEACISLADLLDGKRPEDLDILPLTPYTREVPLMVKGDDGWEISGKAPVPEWKEPVWPSPEAIDELTARKIKKLKAGDSIECNILMMPAPIQEEPDAPPYFGYGLLSAYSEEGYTLQPVMYPRYEEHVADFVNDFMAVLLTENLRPKQISVCDARTEALLTPMAKAIGSKLVRSEDLPELEDMVAHFFGYLEGGFAEDLPFIDWMDEEDELEGFGEFADYDEMPFGEPDDDDYPDEMEVMLFMADILLFGSDAEVRQIPKDVRRELINILDSGVYPERMADAMRDRLMKIK